MSDVITSDSGMTSVPSAPVAHSPGQEKVHIPITIGASIHIPGWVVDLESFRRWARSDDFPERGRFAFLNGVLWMDLDMEQIFSHVDVKTEYASVLRPLAKSISLGVCLTDGVLLSNPAVGLSTEPDGLCFSFATLSCGKVRLVKGAERGYVELEGSPDMVLEVISDGSVKKDTETLRDLYWRAGVLEFWLVDARGEIPIFDILVHTPDGFAATKSQDGWLFSKLFGRHFQLTVEKTALGLPSFSLAARP
jgi:Uma2 family endonuclease